MSSKAPVGWSESPTYRLTTIVTGDTIMANESVPQNQKQPKTMRLAKELAMEYMVGLQNRVGGEKHYIPSKFVDLDKTFQGWLHEGHLIIIAGRPAMGKSAFAQQIAEQVAEQERTVIFFTLEMGALEITERAIARRSGVPVPYLKTAEQIEDNQWAKICRGFEEFLPLPLLVDDSSFDIAGLIHKAKAATNALQKSELPPLGAIVIDYLQLISAKGANRTLEIGQITSALKQLSKELSVPVIALSQLNRGVEGRTEKRPNLSDLRESGNIEQDADMVIFIYRDDYYNPDSEDAGIAEIIVAKNRHGTTGRIKLVFVGERVMFGDLSHE